MAETITITLPDGSTRAVPAGTTAQAIAESIGPRLAKAAVAARVDGEVWDLRRPIPGDASVAILTDRDPAALDVLRHSAAHVLATAVRQLFPQAHIGFGPAIEDGFYYDFEVPQPFTPDDLAAIEAKMSEVAAADHAFVREEVDRAAAEQRFRDDPLKLERLAELGDDETISVYTDGQFVDLCRGPHVQGTGALKHFKLLHAAGAYWRGDERRQMLQRIYGTAWFSQKDLDAYLHRLEEARKRTTASSASSSTCSRSRRRSGPGSCSGILAARSSSGCSPASSRTTTSPRATTSSTRRPSRARSCSTSPGTSRCMPRISIRPWRPARARRRTCAIG